MFIREITKKNIKTKKKSDKVYVYHRLLENYRTDKGPRQRIIMNLGTLDLHKDLWKPLADRIEQIAFGVDSMMPVNPKIEKHAQHFAKVLIDKKITLSTKDSKSETSVEPEHDFVSVDLNSFESSQSRSIGIEYIAYSMMKKLGMIKIFQDLGFSDDDIKYAVIAIVGRLTQPTSERSTHNWAKNISALPELLEDDFSQLSLNKMYYILDKLMEHKIEIEKGLRINERQLFSLKENILLYDITNTYFEGSSNSNPKAKRGPSKEKRTDCPLIATGMVVDELGFPKRSTFMEGNVAEVKTLENMLKGLNAGYENEMFAKPTVIIDAGISCQDNLTWLKKNGYEYICVARNNPLVPEDIKGAEFTIVKDNRNGQVKVKSFKTEDEQIIYCHSDMKEKKENAMRKQYEKRFEDDLKKIIEALQKKRGIKNYDRVMIKIGRLKEKYSPIAHYYEIKVDKDKSEIVTKIEYTRIKDDLREFNFSGSYVLRSSRMDLNETELWNLYVMLTNIEASFRALKTDLNMRPVYHQKEVRCDGHLFVTLLAYHVLVSSRTILKKSDIKYDWTSIKKIMQTMQRVTTSFKCEDGRQVHIRTTSKAEGQQVDILKALKLKINPVRNKKIYM